MYFFYLHSDTKEMNDNSQPNIFSQVYC